ncbi:hypothetical protein VOLCADRAFT_91385 [Volvox carteri f. nagariensis]|uniref:Uncharacterized protein n=1 Tax=Volvox carteri f. nagariensis TaxID=3068 RepID=D8TWX7_VOLCA|nr:uncharacterized protein VOLCADRAFT_91385 [Volvox carteri f. nagariensis]EFJ48230.1 hypothetical protein VOLCADRAFT_91385 [Volvox carteri f. nagariensis]|eukprot:XP_002950915.1 hypothetical protein VOLCADRAFT_91385 [Volvox carteri f. nagariensis]
MLESLPCSSRFCTTGPCELPFKRMVLKASVACKHTVGLIMGHRQRGGNEFQQLETVSAQQHEERASTFLEKSKCWWQRKNGYPGRQEQVELSSRSMTSSLICGDSANEPYFDEVAAVGRHRQPSLAKLKRAGASSPSPTAPFPPPQSVSVSG